MKLIRRLLLFLFGALVLVIFLGRIFPFSERKVLLSPLPTVAPTSFSFAVLSDSHSDYQSLQKALDKARSDGVDFMIVDGDLTTLGKAEELIRIKTILDEVNLPYYVIPGNHDLWSRKSLRNPFGEVFGSSYQAFLKDGVKFILINNGDGLVGVDRIQENWLEQELTDCPKLYCLVFAHMPLNHQVLKHIMGEDSPEVASQAARLVKELVDAQVKELFAGHIHYLSSYELDGLKTTTDGAIYTDNGKQPARFLEVTVLQPEIRLEKKEVWLE